MGIVMGTLVSSDVIIASYIKGQSVGFFSIFWCNWHSLKPFLSRVILTHKDDYGQIKAWDEKYDLFCSLKVNGLAT